MERLEGKLYEIGIIGSIVIMFLTIIFLDKPFELMQGITFDYPMFLVYSLPIIIILGIVLYIIFKVIVKVKKLK